MSGVTIKRRHRAPVMISVVSMIDVLMIMLIFFMVTQSYLNLSMVPAVQADDPSAIAPADAPATPASTLLIRLGPDGGAVVGGRHLELDALQALVSDRLGTAPDTPVVVLPSGAADTQSLIAVIDSVTRGGATAVRIVRIEAGP